MRLAVVVATPAHAALASALSYRSDQPLQPGTLVRVPLGRREVPGVVWGPALEAPAGQEKAISAVLDGVAPLPDSWRRLIDFTAAYYQRGLGEVALAALPPQLRDLQPEQWARRLRKLRPGGTPLAQGEAPALTPQQAQALEAMARGTGPFLLYGATGSGKTEVYLQAVARALAADPQAQALVLVPEINLTPQLQARFEARFGAQAVVALHSGLTPAQRLAGWLAAHTGAARIVLGTRMAVLTPLARLALVVVDEEHDPSYKQQEGARYSARDLAVYRGRLEGAAVILGSATPSLESWQAAERGRYVRVDMPERVGAGALPEVRLIDMNLQPRGTVLASVLLAAIVRRVERGEQVLLFLNRRGYAPVLACTACDWKSDCPHCSAYRVFHKIDRTLRCHHCGFTERVPRACPDCGNLDIAPMGRGTERLEEQIAELLAGVRRPDGEPVRIARIDADSTRGKGALEERLAQVHAGDVDVLVGTQMVTKGHDFRRITLVAALNADTALFSADFRAPERLFALLLQAAGRAGRDAAHAAASTMAVQTFHPAHPLFAALVRHDYPAFARAQLAEREAAGLPPFAFQALIRAEARTQEVAQGFLQAAADATAGLPGADLVTVYPPVPMSVQRVADVERAQMVLESATRPALQRLLAAWQPVLQDLRPKGLIRWAIDVDPLAI